MPGGNKLFSPFLPCRQPAQLDLTRQGGATDVPSTQPALHPGGQGSPQRHRSHQSSGSSVQRESCVSGGGNSEYGSCLEPMTPYFCGVHIWIYMSNCRFAEVAVDLCPCDNIIPYETVVYKGEGGSLTALIW